MEVKRHFLFLTLFLAFLFVGCATHFDKGRGRYHSVREGESIWTVAHFYKVDAQELAEFNNIDDPNELKSGMKIYIPAKERKTYKKLPFKGKVTSRSKRIKEKEEGTKKDRIVVDHGRFQWPYDGTVLSGYGIRGGRRHDGIDIKGPMGAKIKAAGDGEVVFSGRMRGYGNLVLIRHKDDFYTAYAHNKKNLVKVGQKIKVGNTVALLGRTGRATGAHLHFEVRDGQRARNPLFFLPSGDVQIAQKSNKKRVMEGRRWKKL